MDLTLKIRNSLRTDLSKFVKPESLQRSVLHSVCLSACKENKKIIEVYLIIIWLCIWLLICIIKYILFVISGYTNFLTAKSIDRYSANFTKINKLYNPAASKTLRMQRELKAYVLIILIMLPIVLTEGQAASSNRTNYRYRREEKKTVST